jgi:hypothetical protein
VELQVPDKAKMGRNKAQEVEVKQNTRQTQPVRLRGSQKKVSKCKIFFVITQPLHSTYNFYLHSPSTTSEPHHNKVRVVVPYII